MEPPMKPPENFQRPGVPGAGNILDPAVRGDLRERLHAAMHDACQQLRGQAAPPSAAERAPGAAAQPHPEAPAANVQEETPADPPAPAPSSAGPHPVGPYPHGDVDLSMLAANVTPARPNRGKSARRFYFLAQPEQTAQPTPRAANPQAPPRSQP